MRIRAPNAAEKARLLSYMGAVLATLVATLLRLALAPLAGAAVPFVAYFAAALFLAWYRGFGAAAFSILLSAVAGMYFILPAHAFFPSTRADGITVGSFVLVGSGVSFLLDLQRRTLKRADAEAIRRRAAENAERDQRGRLEAALASIGDAVISTDLEGRIVFANKVAQSMLRAPEGGLAGRRLDDVIRMVSEFTRAKVESPVTKILREGANAGPENHRLLIAQDGTEIPIEGSGAPIRGEGGQIEGVVLAIRDITHRNRAEEARRLLASIVESSDDAITSEDLNGVITSWNHGAERMFSYRADEIIGQPISTIAVPEHNEMASILERIRLGEQIAPYETIRRTRTGGILRVSLTASPLRDAGGRVIGTSKIFRDITELRRAETAVLEGEQRFRTMANHAPVQIWLAGLDKKCAWINRAWLDFTGRTLEQEIGDGWAEDVHPDDLERCTAIYEESFDRREPFKVELRLRRHDGQWRWALSHGVPLNRADGTFLGYIGSCVDIHDRKLAEDILRNANEALQEYADIVDPAAVLVRDTDDRIIRWTSGAQALYGFTAADAVGRISHELFQTGFPEPLDQIRAKLFADGRWEGELRHKASNGREIVVASVWALHRDNQGEPTAILQVNNNITERKRLEEEIRFRAEELETFLDAVPLFVWIAHDGDCRVITGNRAANELVGVEPDLSVSQTPDEIAPIRVKHFKPDGSEYRPEELPMQRAIASREIINNVELEFGLPDGSRVPAVGSAAPLFDSGGRVRGCVAAFMDTTERREANERFRLAVEAAPNGMVLVDQGGKIILVNSEMERLFGYNREEMIGQPVEFLTPQKLREEHRRYRETFCTAPEARLMGEGRDLRARRKDGSEFPVEIGLNPIGTSQGRWVLGAVVDITARKRMDEERLELMSRERTLAADRALRETEAELERIARALTVGELAASIAHEVNQPLAGVVTNAEAGLRWLGAEMPNTEEAKASLALIVRDGNRASAVIRRIREFLKKDSQEMASVDINETIQEALAMARTELVKGKVELRVLLADELPFVVSNRIQLQQVVLNLIMNGRDAMAAVFDRSRELMVSSQESDDGGVLVTVRDSGAGIEPQNLHRIFDALFSTKPMGMGMGLSISRSIIEAHGGRIWAALNHGPGMTVQFSLPAANAGPRLTTGSDPS